MDLPDTEDSLVLHFEGAAHPVLFYRADAVAAHVRSILSLWPSRAPDRQAGLCVVAGDGGSFTVASPFLDPPIAGLTAVAAACGAIVDCAQSCLDANLDWLCLHCAAFEIAGRLVVLTGSAHAGKSTLAARMAAEDVTVYCDDMLPLVAPDNLGFALGIPPRPRLPLPDAAGPVLAAHLRDHAAASDGKYCYLDTHNLAAHGRTAPIGAVILLDRRADGPAGFAPASRAEALKHLFQRNMVRTASTLRIADRLEAMLAAVPCVKLHYSALDEAAALLTDSFASWPAPQSALLDRQPAPGAPRDTRADADRPPADVPDIGYVRAPGIVMRRHDDEAFLFDADGMSVLHLNPFALAIWSLLEAPLSPSEAAHMLAVAFPDTDPQEILADTRALFAKMLAHGAVIAAPQADRASRPSP